MAGRPGEKFLKAIASSVAPSPSSTARPALHRDEATFVALHAKQGRLQSLRRALVFEETYLDYALKGKAVSSRDFHRLMRFLAHNEEDEPAAASVYDQIHGNERARSGKPQAGDAV